MPSAQGDCTLIAEWDPRVLMLGVLTRSLCTLGSSTPRWLTYRGALLAVQRGERVLPEMRECTPALPPCPGLAEQVLFFPFP